MTQPRPIHLRALTTLSLVLLVTFACKPREGGQDEQAESQNQANTAEEATSVVLYSGRNEEMVGPIIEAFEASTGIDVVVNYAGSAELAATLLEEGDRSPADLFLAQDASTLGFLEEQGVLAPLPEDILNTVASTYRSTNSKWVGLTGRARVLSYNSAELSVEDLPADLEALTAEEWRGRVGWAPENASFQSFVAAMVSLEGEEATLAWLEAMSANEPTAFPSNTPMVTAIGRGELDVGLTNHYYLYRLRDEYGEDFAAENHYFRSGDAASFVNVTGVGVLNTSEASSTAHQLVSFLLSDEAQTMFAEANHEFPLANGITSPDDLPEASGLNAPELNLADVNDLETTHRLLREAGVLP